MRKTSIIGLLLLFAIGLSVACMTTGCGAVLGLITAVVDASPELDAALDKPVIKYFTKHPDRVAPVNSATTTIIDNFDQPPASDTAAAFTLAGVYINTKGLDAQGLIVLQRIAAIIEPVIVDYLQKHGVDDQGQIADIVGRVIKRINRVTGDMLKVA